MQTHLQRPPSKTLQSDQTFSHTIHHHILTVILLSQNPGWWKERPWSLPVLASFTLNHQIVRIVGKPTCTMSVSKPIASTNICKQAHSMYNIHKQAHMHNVCNSSSFYAGENIRMRLPINIHIPISAFKKTIRMPIDWRDKKQLRHKNWLIAGRDKNQPIDGFCNSYHHQSCNTEISIILWVVWGLCNSHHHQRLQYKKINHPLGFVMFMQLSSSSKTAIQKNQSFFGVCEACAQLSSSKTAIQKNQLFFGGLWGLCKGG